MSTAASCSSEKIYNQMNCQRLHTYVNTIGSVIVCMFRIVSSSGLLIRFHTTRKTALLQCFSQTVLFLITQSRKKTVYSSYHRKWSENVSNSQIQK